MNPLQQIPARVRGILYWASYVLGTAAGAITVAWGIVAANLPDVRMPLWLVIVTALLLFLQGQLGSLAGNNLTPDDGTTVVGELVKDSGPGVGEVLDKVEEVLAEVKARRTPPTPPPAATTVVVSPPVAAIQTPPTPPTMPAPLPDPVVPSS